MHHAPLSEWWGHFPEGRLISGEEEDEEPHHCIFITILWSHFPRREIH